MPTPLPELERTNLRPPEADEVAFLGRGVVSAITPTGGLTEFQALLVESMFEAMTTHTIDAAAVEEITPSGFAEGMTARNEMFRSRIVQIMILGGLVLRPLPAEVAERIDAFARELMVCDGMLAVARGFASGDLGLASVDFDRNGYTADWSPERSAALHTSTALADAWQDSIDDPALSERWAALEHLPPGTLGRRMFEFYRARGFAFPGQPGSAPPLLAQHDWVHLLADYGTRVESELEVFGFIARANDDPRGFSLLAMVVSLFETGYLETGAGLFQAFPGQLSRDGMAVRVADAMRRGALSHGLDGAPDVDLLAVDWFTLADRPVAELREAFGIPSKSETALAAGSVGPWEPGGISEFQLDAGRKAAAGAGRRYESYGASL